jgi:EVE domain
MPLPASRSAFIIQEEIDCAVRSNSSRELFRRASRSHQINHQLYQPPRHPGRRGGRVTTAWVGIASRERVTVAVEGGFCQLNHGRKTPVRRLQPGDYIIYYAPRERMRAGDVVQAFVAFGKILPGEPYRADASKRFRPFRRYVKYSAGTDASIRPLLQKLSFTRDRVSWGRALRLGTFKIEPNDLEIIADAMRIAVA